ncbi:MAG: nucleotidyltransferase domain-containing protein [Candidatus Hatepunaea meridiana]|nr:nucleotidyltransferase domain-containing protein [Candidatus Hatepunaea meridiana]
MDKQLQQIIDKIVAYVDPVKIYLFGSRVRGDSREDSDYDIAIIYDGELSKREVTLGIYDQFEEFNFSMDLFVLASQELEKYKRIANTLAREITENGKVVYG